LIFLTSELALAAFVNNSGYTQDITKTACKAEIVGWWRFIAVSRKGIADRESRKIAPNLEKGVLSWLINTS
jgi:hypothetical protein